MTDDETVAMFSRFAANSPKSPGAVLALIDPIPEGAMRVAPGSDAVVWRVNADHCGEL